MRARNIKPGFFLNCELSDVDFASRLLFIGLWCYADREGRFEWKPKQIKAAIFPYDNVNIDKLLCNLMSLHVITCHDTTGYVENFKKHQSPHPHEAKSRLPEKPLQNQCHDMSLTLHEMSVKCNADIIIEDIRIEDIKNQKNCASVDTRLSDFQIFWDAFDLKKGKGGAESAWKKIKGYSPQLFQDILTAAKVEADNRPALMSSGGSPKWAQGWITERRWEDEPITYRPMKQHSLSADERRRQTTAEACIGFLRGENDGTGQADFYTDNGADFGSIGRATNDEIEATGILGSVINAEFESV